MQSSTSPDFDFDGWALLAKSDPAAFEERRRAVIEQAIAAMPQERQARLRGLQWRIDLERARYRHPLVSCSQLFNMMWASVYGEGGLVDALNGRVAPASAAAEVLPFSSKASIRGQDVAARS